MTDFNIADKMRESAVALALEVTTTILEQETGFTQTECERIAQRIVDAMGFPRSRTAEPA